MLGVRAGCLTPRLNAWSADLADTPFPFGGAALDDFNFQHDGHLSPLWKLRLAQDQNKLTRFANSRPGSYFRWMNKAFEFCIPVRGTEVPARTDWLHEIKYDGYRLRVERDGDRMRLITRNGYDWTKRYPWIVESALKNRMKQFVIDGEAVILGVDGVSDFDALHSGKHNEEVQLYAFDMLAGDGDDMRSLPLSMRKANLARLLARRADGIFVAPFEQGEIGPDLFRAACNMGLEGLVSKRRDRPYRAGRSPNWIKVKNRNHPAMSRVRDSF
jgi:bifunctional non-homologous end joining protein LigD